MSDNDIPTITAPATVVPPSESEAVRTADSLSPKTTSEQDLSTAGQRHINLIWETTQMKIALSVIWAALAVSTVLSIFGGWLGKPDVQLAAVVFVFGVANLVTGFYFGRTNHTKTGGVGDKEAGR